MYWMGFTLNGLTLLALTLSVGIVIDDAIVVLENIYRFIEEKHMNPFEAAIEGTREIGLAVLATTLSLIAVFLPVAFMTGIVGRFMNSFGLTMAFAIFISLIVSFTLTPMLASRWIKPSPHPVGPEAPDNMPISVPVESERSRKEPRRGKGTPSEDPVQASSKQSGLFKPIDAVYSALLKFAMRHRWLVVIVSFVTLFSAGPIGMAVNKNFLPEDDESQFQVTARAPEGTTLSATEKIGNRIADEVRKLPGVDYTVLTIGNDNQQTVNLINIFVKMVEVEKRPGLSQQDVMQRARNEILPQFSALRTSVGLVSAFSGGGNNASVQYYVAGPSLEKLTALLSAIARVGEKARDADGAAPEWLH